MEILLSIFDIHPLTSSDIILLVTAVIVFVYTRAAQKANELQTSPAITLSFRETTVGSGQKNGAIMMRNVGKGPALDVEFLPFCLPEEGRGLFTYSFVLEDRLLEVDQERVPRMWVSTPEGGLEASDIQRLLFRLLPESYAHEKHDAIWTTTPAVFVVNYKGVSGRSYHSIYRLYSVRPPFGDALMQLLHYGRGKRGMIAGYWHHLTQRRLRQEGHGKVSRSVPALLHISLHRMKQNVAHYSQKWRRLRKQR